MEVLSMIKEVEKAAGAGGSPKQGMGAPHQCNVHTIGSQQEPTLFITVENTHFK